MPSAYGADDVERFAGVADAEVVVITSCEDCGHEEEHAATDTWSKYCTECGSVVVTVANFC